MATDGLTDKGICIVALRQLKRGVMDETLGHVTTLASKSRRAKDRERGFSLYFIRLDPIRICKF